CRPSAPHPSSCAWLPRPLHPLCAGRRIPSCAPQQSRRFPPPAETPGSVVIPCLERPPRPVYAGRSPIIGQTSPLVDSSPLGGCAVENESVYFLLIGCSVVFSKNGSSN